MKIAVNSRFYQKTNTGIHNYTRNLYGELLKSDTKNEYLFFQTNAEKSIGDTKVMRLPDNKVADIAFDCFAVNKLISLHKPDVFHSPCFVLPFHKAPNVKYITTIHDLVFLKYPDLANTQTRSYYKVTVPISAKNANVILADSLNTKSDIVNLLGVPEKKVQVLYPAINDEYLDLSEKVDTYKQKYIYLNASSFRRKNILNTIQAFARSKHVHGLGLVISGLLSNHEAKQVHDIAEKHGVRNRIKFLGYVTDEEVKSLYRNAELFVYPSLYEGFGLPIAEAMSQECLVINSNTSSCIELNNDPLLTFDPTNVDEITNTLNNALDLSKERKANIIGANQFKARQFTPSNCAQQFLKMLEEVMK